MSATERQLNIQKALDENQIDVACLRNALNKGNAEWAANAFLIYSMGRLTKKARHIPDTIHGQVDGIPSLNGHGSRCGA